MNLAAVASAVLDSVIVVGDYNLPQLQWIFDHDLNSYLPTNASTEAEISLTEILFSAGLHQICSIPNNNMRLLDLAFCNDPGNVIMFESPVSIIPTDRHHKPYVLCVEVHSNSSPTDCTGRFDFVLDYSKCNFDLIAAAFDSTNWEFIGANDNVNVAVDAFYRKLHSVLRLRNQLRKARKCYTKNRTEDQRRRLRSLERDFKELNDNLYRQHISRFQQNLKRDPSSFWKHFKSKRRHATIPVDISFNGVAASNMTESTNMFADFFQSVFSSADYETDSNYLASIQSHDVNLPMPSLTEQEVFERLSTVDPSKGTGPDDIPHSVLKNCAASLAAPICHLFNRSLRERTFPNAWRIAAITPIYKSGNAHCVENYRPISILCAISKIFEVLMHERMYAAIKPFIADSQHGFVKKKVNCHQLNVLRELAEQQFGKRM
ncbi:uncharacterized protein LOC129752587 [Uranotaenia lowii]|uniref:uncharacterized protein LOC129752587 n=1 Tax=Uranotaenia lowii TaxID=190385 RepID=UPI0024787B06|nr:uncharacterized protein LOC129752587 [Uranotaenia lowii]